MSETEQVQQLKEMLANNRIVQRRAGIALAAEMLASDQQLEAVRALLTDRAKNDDMMTVREAAQAALDADAKRRNPPPPDYVFGAKCTFCHHISYLDKREVCPKHGNITREVTTNNGLELDTIFVKCKHCGKEFKTPVPCKGYK